MLAHGGQQIAVLVENKADVAAFADFKGNIVSLCTEIEASGAAPAASPAAAPAAAPAAPAAAAAATPAPAAAPVNDGRVLASPLAKSIAGAKGIDLSQVAGTGPNGRIIRADVEEFKPRVTQAAPAPAPRVAAPASAGDAFIDIPVSQIRKVTADRLLESKQTIPHYYLTIDVNVEKLSALRKELNDAAKGQFKLSVNDFVVKAAALAMRKVPIVNSAWYGSFMRQYKNVDVNVAVNTEQGLFTPIVFNANLKGLAEISESVKVLAEKAKQGKLELNEFVGGTFTVSNLGALGVKQFAAVINPPQAAILAVGGIESRVIPRDNRSDAYTTAQFLTVTLSCDHRVIDGAIGAQWLQAFKDLLENPVKFLL